MTNLNVGLIGYGEVGKIFYNGLKAKGLAWVGAWDVIFGDAVFGGAQRLHATAHGVKYACRPAGDRAQDPSRHCLPRSQLRRTRHHAKGCGADRSSRRQIS